MPFDYEAAVRGMASIHRGRAPRKADRAAVCEALAHYIQKGVANRERQRAAKEGRTMTHEELWRFSRRWIDDQRHIEKMRTP